MKLSWENVRQVACLLSLSCRRLPPGRNGLLKYAQHFHITIAPKLKNSWITREFCSYNATNKSQISKNMRAINPLPLTLKTFIDSKATCRRFRCVLLLHRLLWSLVGMSAYSQNERGLYTRIVFRSSVFCSFSISG